MQKRSDIKLFLMVFAATSLALAFLLEFRVIERVSFAMEKGRLRALRETLPPAERLADWMGTRRAVADLVAPAVVSIETDFNLHLVFYPSSERDNEERLEPGDGLARSDVHEGPHPADDAGLEHFERLESALSIQQGLGSGFIFDAEHGYVVTNAHVVDGGSEVHVYLADGRHAEARVLGVDRESDLAVIHVDLPRLHALSFGDSEAIRVGDEILAVGNPFGLEGTVSQGIISAVDRRNVRVGGSRYPSLLQTDAVITPGSSGGPVVNMRGEVVGISTAMATNSGRYDGIGFAIPSGHVRAILDDLIEGGPGLLGVMVGSAAHPAWKESADEAGWTDSYGALVTEVMPGTPAEQAGIEVGDIILSIDQIRIETHEQLASLVARTKPQTAVRVGVWRKGRRLTLPVRIGRKYAPRPQPQVASHTAFKDPP